MPLRPMVTWRQKAGFGLVAGWLTLAALFGYGYVSRPSENPGIIVVLKPSESSYTASSTPQNSNQPYPAPSDTIFGTSLPSQGIQGGPGPSATSTPNRDTNSSPTSESTQTPTAGLALSGGGSGPIIISGGSKKGSIESIVNKGNLETLPYAQNSAESSPCTRTHIPDKGNRLYKIELRVQDTLGREWNRSTVAHPGSTIYIANFLPDSSHLEIALIGPDGLTTDQAVGTSSITMRAATLDAKCQEQARKNAGDVLISLWRADKGIETATLYGPDAARALIQGLSRPS
jgi:hypothetical protein